ncbi:MAG TPA: L,D-transpeptidase family protein [Clostridia bacterium]|nr:L,D-transpeptidase family protein [Clostridia bacterium]
MSHRVKKRAVCHRLTLIVSFGVLLLCVTAAVIRITGTSGRIPADPVKKPKLVYSIFIDIESNRIYLLKSGKLFRSYQCATGKSETPSPAGSYEIISKAHWGEGFGGYWIGIDCPWGIYGIHGTRRPDTVGYAASHGCFRMYNQDCKEIYGLVSVGTKVVITAGCYGPFGNGFRDIRPHMYGLDVQAVQKRLKELGYYKGRCNGKYENESFKTAIHMFQKDNCLKVTDVIYQSMVIKMGFVIME